MDGTNVRIEKISIRNYKNIKESSLSLVRNKKYRASITGIYGQNGSGKTAVIDALDILKYLLSGRPVPADYADCINVDARQAAFSFVFSVNDRNGDLFTVEYSFCISRMTSSGPFDLETDGTSSGVYVSDESISYSLKSEDESRNKNKQLLIKTTDSGLLRPGNKAKLLIGNSKNNNIDLQVIKRLTETTSRSFLFSEELSKIISENCKSEEYLTVLGSLADFGISELFILKTNSTGLVSVNALPVLLRRQTKADPAVPESILIDLNGNTLIPKEAYGIVTEVTASLNKVLPYMIPGLRIGVKKLSTELDSSGEESVRIQLTSLKNSKEIPLKYESEGTKKLISMLQLLINVYNDPSFTVAIDELDSGVFEYLLGEMLRIISENGKGQLVFTSHNLRPLETLDKSFIVFTTTNPENKFIHLTNVKANNNLRDFYYRDIILGEQSEQVYDPTDNYDIALSFREAGDAHGS